MPFTASLTESADAAEVYSALNAASGGYGKKVVVHCAGEDYNGGVWAVKETD